MVTLTASSGLFKQTVQYWTCDLSLGYINAWEGRFQQFQQQILIKAFFFSFCLYSGTQDTLEIPRLPEPSSIFPVPHRRKAPAPPIPDPDALCLISPLERPKTLEFAPRPRPTPARMRADPWKLGSLSRTLSSSPGSSCDSPLGSGDSSIPATRPNLMDMDVEGQSSDPTVPLCGQQQPATLCGQQYLS